MAKKTTIDYLIEQLFDLTGHVWQVGIVVTSLLLFLSYKSYTWVDSIVADGEGRPIMAALEKLSWFLYLLPLFLLLASLIFALKAYATYINKDHL